MKTTHAVRPLGRSDLSISTLGVGAWAMGGDDWAFGWGPQDDSDSVAAIRRALDGGINWIDTAAVYGFGRSEEVVGKALAGTSDKPYIFTKCSRVANDDGTGTARTDLSRASIRRECEASLRRLRIETIDLYQMHWPTDRMEDIDEGWAAMAELQREGKVRWIGVSNFNVAQLDRARRIAPVTSLQPPYSAIRRDIEAEILPYCEAHDIGVIVYSPMQAGLLTGAMTAERAKRLPASDWRSRNPEFQEPKLTRNLGLVDILREVGAAHGRSPGETALAWVLRKPAVTGAIVGMRNSQQVDGVIGALDFRLSPEEIAKIDGYKLT